MRVRRPRLRRWLLLQLPRLRHPRRSTRHWGRRRRRRLGKRRDGEVVGVGSSSVIALGSWRRAAASASAAAFSTLSEKKNKKRRRTAKSAPPRTAGQYRARRGLPSCQVARRGKSAWAARVRKARERKHPSGRSLEQRRPQEAGSRGARGQQRRRVERLRGASGRDGVRPERRRAPGQRRGVKAFSRIARDSDAWRQRTWEGAVSEPLTVCGRRTRVRIRAGAEVRCGNDRVAHVAPPRRARRLELRFAIPSGAATLCPSARPASAASACACCPWMFCEKGCLRT